MACSTTDTEETQRSAKDKAGTDIGSVALALEPRPSVCHECEFFMVVNIIGQTRQNDQQ